MEVIFLAIIYYSSISLLLLFSALNGLQFANRYSVSILKWNKTGLAIFTIDGLVALIVISYAFLNSLIIMLFIFGLMLLLNLIFVFVPSIKDIMLTSEMLDEENAYLNDISTAAIYVVFVVWLYFGT